MNVNETERLTLLLPRLDLFDGSSGAAAGEAASGGTSAGDGAAAVGGEAGKTGGIGGPKKGPGTGGRGGESAGPAVLYGKQAAGGGQTGGGAAAAAGQGAEGGQNPQHQSTSDTLEDRQRRWQELKSGEFRDLYDEEARRLVSRSAREAAALRDQAGRMQPILDMLLDRYKIRDGDMGKLLQAVENDDAYWSQAAEEAGMSVDQYKRFQKLQRQNAQLLQAQEQRLGRERAENQLRAWNDQAEQLRGVYPSFDLTREVRNRDFLAMLRSGVPLRQAYEVVHMDEIRAATAAMQAKATEKAITANIKAKGARPQENGAGASSGFTIKDDVSRLTAKDRAEIAKRAARGEVITF